MKSRERFRYVCSIGKRSPQMLEDKGSQMPQRVDSCVKHVMSSGPPPI